LDSFNLVHFHQGPQAGDIPCLEMSDGFCLVHMVFINIKIRESSLIISSRVKNVGGWDEKRDGQEEPGQAEAEG
jgi:hypothetical protein